jgi:hypothetical protein
MNWDGGSTHICIETLQNNKYDEYIILVYDTMHYEGSIIYKYYMHDTCINDRTSPRNSAHAAFKAFMSELNCPFLSSNVSPADIQADLLYVRQEN